MTLSSRNSLILIALVLLFIPALLNSYDSKRSFVGVSASNVCICECCDGSSCSRGMNGTFTIDSSCDDCTTDFCKEHYDKCVREEKGDLPPLNVVAQCVYRDSWMFPASIVTFLAIAFALYGLALARFAVSLIQLLKFVEVTNCLMYMNCISGLVYGKK